ncbi:MAG TPA: S8 family serine peptidase [Mycobacteriales bacterium]|nr:S8 family serine peptidase [Mycobacteriales bacterium]
MTSARVVGRTAVISAVLLSGGLLGPTTAASAHGAAAAPPARQAAASGETYYHSGRVLVRFRSSTGETTRRLAHRQAGASRRSTMPRLGVEILDTATPDRTLALLHGRPDVLWAEPELVVRRLEEVTATAERRELSLDSARAADPRFDGAGVRVAVIDDGVYPVADLAGRVVDKGNCSQGACTATGGVNGLDDPGYGSHGTAVAAIIAAAADNGVGIVGAAPRATIFSYRVFPDILAGAADSAIASAIMEAADDGADVANLSLGTPFDSRVLRDAVSYARRVRPDMVIVAAAGNDGGDRPSYPAASPTVLSVGASTPGPDGSWQVAGFSTRGDVDVLAPGTGIRTWYRQPSGPDDPGLGAPLGTTLVDGTSFAAPAVAGVVAGLAGVGVRGDRARAAVVASAEPAATRIDVPTAASGSGRADALTALRLATGTASYAAAFVDDGTFVARDVGVRRVETLRFDPAPGSGSDAAAPLQILSGGGEITGLSDLSNRPVGNGTLLRGLTTYRAVQVTATDEVRLAVGAPEDDGAVFSLRLVVPTAGPEGVPVGLGQPVGVDLVFGLTSSYVRTIELQVGQLLVLDFAYAENTSDVDVAVWAPPVTGGVATAADTPDALEPTGTRSGSWVYTARRTGRHAFGLVAFSPAGNGRHQVSARLPTVVEVTAPRRVLTTTGVASFTISWGLVDPAPVPTPPGVRWDVRVSTVSRDRLGRLRLGPARVLATETPATSLRIDVSSVGRYRVQVRAIPLEGPASAWSAPREIAVLALRPVS